MSVLHSLKRRISIRLRQRRKARLNADLRSLEGTLRVVLDRAGVNVVLDVGAHRGEYVGRLRSNAGYRGPIVSFEPQQSASDVLRAAAAADPAWTIRQEAVGNETGSFTLNVFSDGMFSSLHSAGDYGVERYSFLGRATHEEVSVVRLDDIADDVLADVQDPRVLLKVDTQGHDLAVLAGAASLIERAVVALQIEIGVISIYEDTPDISEVLRTLQSYGFDIVGLFPIARDRDGLRVLEFDGVFVRRGVDLTRRS